MKKKKNTIKKLNSYSGCVPGVKSFQIYFPKLNSHRMKISFHVEFVRCNGSRIYERRLTSLPAPVPVGVRVLAGLRESEETGNVELLVLQVVAPGVGALDHADLEVPSLLAEALDPLRRPVIRRRGVLGGARIVVVHQLGQLRDAGRRRRRRRRRRRLRPVGREITSELVVVLGIDEVI